MSRYQKERGVDPARFAGMTDAEVESELRNLRTVSLEALAFELSTRGFYVNNYGRNRQC